MGRKMKDSGVEWIGEIPEDWNVTSLKRLANIQTGSTPSKDKQELYYGEKGVPWIKPEDLGKDFPISSTTEYLTNEGTNNARIMPNDSVYVCCIGSVGKVGYANKKCSCNQQINALSFNDRMNWKYGYYMTISQESEYDLYSNGNVVKIINTTGQSELKCPVPPVEEQKIISSYLDKKCLEIYTTIKKTNESIEMYKSLKQSLITRAVTKGVRGKREMKDSGIEWIGEIPSEWKLAQLGRFVTISSGISVGRIYPPEIELVEVPYLRVANVQGDHIDLSDVAVIKVTKDEAEKYKLHSGSLLMTEGGDRDKLGRGSLWSGEIENCIHQNHVFEVCPNENLLVRFLDYVTTSDVARIYFDITAKKTTNLACTNKTTILKFKLPIPSVNEQQEIISYLDEKCNVIDNLIIKKKQLITELEAYKKSIIYEYVTGKREVLA